MANTKERSPNKSLFMFGLSGEIEEEDLEVIVDTLLGSVEDRTFYSSNCVEVLVVILLPLCCFCGMVCERLSPSKT